MVIDTLKIEALNSKTVFAFVFNKFNVKNIAKADVFVAIFQIQWALTSEYFTVISSEHVASPYFNQQKIFRTNE